jgi:SAM-dependent methyltransferase
VRLTHFAAFAPRCPVCVGAGRAPEPLIVASVAERTEVEILAGILHCPDCQHEYPVLDGVPVIVPDLRRALSERGLELLLRDDIDPSLESLFGDAIGPDSWLDAIRMMQSTYGWDSYADLDPEEAAPAPDGPQPGAAARCLRRLVDLAPAKRDRRRILDLGCAAGRTSFALAEEHPEALVLGIDLQLGLLRLAAKAARGQVSYPRRRVGLVYDRRRFAVDLPGADRVDFWACDALALPFAREAADLCVGLNLLDCVPDPRRLLESLAGVTTPEGDILLATPYDWSTRATPPQAWLGGHSQRAPHAGAAEPFLHALLAAMPDLSFRAEDAAWPWQTRLHERSTVSYRSHLVALSRSKV